MEKRKRKNRAANLIMGLIIALIVALGVSGVGYIRGWFGDAGADSAVMANVRGIVNMTRNDITYPLEQDTVLRRGDAIRCTPGGSAAIRVGEGCALAIGERADMTILAPERDRFSVDMTNGEMFILAAGWDQPLTLNFEGKQVKVANSIASLSCRSGAQDVNVYYGQVGEASADECLRYVGDEMSVTPLAINTLNAFNIAQLRGANSIADCCFTNDELDQLEAERALEREGAASAEMSDEMEALGLEHECTVTIVCDTILDNYDNLDPAKAEFVPEDGVILATAKVPFAQGETALDATVRACEAYDIQIEYSWSPAFNSSYVEGINQLYEFDCGPESGWMFRVNGWFPNYGASAYVLEDGDDIVWAYTCVGLGADVGGQST